MLPMTFWNALSLKESLLFILIPLRSEPMHPIKKKSSFVQVMAWRLFGYTYVSPGPSVLVYELNRCYITVCWSERTCSLNHYMLVSNYIQYVDYFGTSRFVYMIYPLQSLVNTLHLLKWLVSLCVFRVFIHMPGEHHEHGIKWRNVIPW